VRLRALALRGEEAKRYWDQLHALVAELDRQLVYLTGYVRAETASTLFDWDETFQPRCCRVVHS